MSLLNMQVEFAELILSNDYITDLVVPPSNLVIYRYQRVQRLISALTSAYPLLSHLIGENAFQLAANQYIEQYPSRSGNIDEYGAYFSDFLTQYPHTKHLVYLPELATFEWIIHDLQRAADVEPFHPGRLKEIPIERYGDLQFIIHPACQLHRFHYPILNIIELCHGRINELETLETNPTYLFIARQNNDISQKTISPDEFTFLQELQNNQSLETAMQAALTINSEFNLNNTLTGYIKNNTIIDFILP